MKTIERDIVGAFIFSADNKILLGHNKKGGVYQNQLVIPGGGIEHGESKSEAVKREILEETGIDITNATVTRIEGVSTGESQKTHPETGERVLVKMNFYDFIVQIGLPSNEIELRFDDDYAEATWYTPEELSDKNIGPATKSTLKKLKFI